MGPGGSRRPALVAALVVDRRAPELRPGAPAGTRRAAQPGDRVRRQPALTGTRSDLPGAPARDHRARLRRANLLPAWIRGRSRLCEVPPVRLCRLRPVRELPRIAG